MSALIDLTGKRFGALTAVRRDGEWYECECLCGNTRRMRAGYLRAAQRGGHSSSCGQCRQRGPALKYAVTYRGELRSIRELMDMTGIAQRTLHGWIKRGVMSEERIDRHLSRKAYLREQKAQMDALGLSHDTVYQRKKYWGNVPEVYTTPLSHNAKARRVA